MFLKYFLMTSLATLPMWMWLLIVWTLIWKAIALWTAGRRNHLVWFVVLFIVNTAGILEILYIFVFSKMQRKKVANVQQARRKKRRR